MSQTVETSVLSLDLANALITVLYRTYVTTVTTMTHYVTNTHYITAVVATAVTRIYSHPLTVTTVVVQTEFTITEYTEYEQYGRQLPQPI